jgi:hypothetical protein
LAIAREVVVEWNAVAAVGGLVAAVIALVALIVQSRQTGFALGVDLLLKLDERFESAAMLECRRHAARGLLEGRPKDAADVLNFFELVGLLLRRKAIAELMVWHDLSYWVINYYEATSEYIAQCRRQDANVWSEVAWLYRQMTDMERRHCGVGHLGLRGTRQEFLEREASAHAHHHDDAPRKEAAQAAASEKHS